MYSMLRTQLTHSSIRHPRNSIPPYRLYIRREVFAAFLTKAQGLKYEGARWKFMIKLPAWFGQCRRRVVLIEIESHSRKSELLCRRCHFPRPPGWLPCWVKFRIGVWYFKLWNLYTSNKDVTCYKSYLQSGQEGIREAGLSAETSCD